MRFVTLLHLCQNMFPRVYTAWGAKMRSLIEFVYLRKEFKTCRASGNVGWGVLETKVTTKRKNLAI